MKNLRAEKGNSAIVVTIALVLLAVVAVVTLTGDSEVMENAGNTMVEAENNISEEIPNNSININEIMQEENTNTQTHEHEYSIFLTSTKSTCATQGNEKRKCKYCDDIQTVKKELDPNNHPGETEVQYVNINNTHHSKNTVCTSCLQPIAQEKQIHTHAFEEKISEATCADKARNKYVCTVCKEIAVIEEGDTLAHTWDEGIVTKKPTDSESGITTYTCSVCKETKTETIYKED